MAANNYISKDSQSIASLVAYILDTKPFSRKLSEIGEEFQFNDDFRVSVIEKLSIKTKISATWNYNYFSSANSSFRSMPVQRLVKPSFFSTYALVGRDENTDMASVPYVYSKKAFDGIGVRAAYVRRRSGIVQPLTESVDYFQSHGSFQFQVKQTLDANGQANPTWNPTFNDNLISAASAQTRINALDLTNPQSAINQIKAILNTIGTAIPTDADVQRELTALRVILAVPNLPRTYEALFTYATFAAPVGVDLNALHSQLSALSSPLFFNLYSDISFYETGKLYYRDVNNTHVRVYNIVPNLDSDYEEWTLTSVDGTTFRVSGSTAGFIGFFTAGQSFTSARIAFSSEYLGVTPVGEAVLLTPANKVVIAKGAPLETWNIIKVNPIAHSQAIFTSTRYGKIRDQAGVDGSITILDESIASTSITITATSSKFFEIVSSADDSYAGTAQVGVPYDDGVIGFTIIAGTVPFARGDGFSVNIQNLPPQVVGFDLGFGYDLDAFDNDHLVYNNTNINDSNYQRKINFSYDGRFADYDLTTMNLSVDVGTVNNREWRIRALSNGVPISTQKKDGGSPTNDVDLQDATSGVDPDVAASAAPLFSMLGDSNPDSDLTLFFSNSFAVEYSDDDYNTVTQIGTVPVGATFNSPEYGISFTLVRGSKPFIAASSDAGAGVPRVLGGDTFSFKIQNPVPTITERPIALSSLLIPRLLMHSDSYFYAPSATWSVKFTTPTSYTVQGIQTDTNVGQLVGPVTGSITLDGIGEIEGYSFKQLGIHFTIVAPAGFIAGDEFTFETYANKPSYLVHGSVTGWTDNAYLGRFYWNDRIGFKIKTPESNFYIGRDITTSSGMFLQRLREDCPSLSYTFSRNTTNTGYMVTRSDLGPVGYVKIGQTFSDIYVDVMVSTGASQPELKLQITADELPLWNAADTVILRPAVTTRLPAFGDTVIVQKTNEGRVSLNLVPSGVSQAPLAPITIDQRFIDTSTSQTIPLSLTSPETAILSSWLPYSVVSSDSATSLAEFADPATIFDFTSASTGNPIGTMAPLTDDIDEPISFTWDQDFFDTYLPLNAEANIVVTGNGWNERVQVRFVEGFRVLVDGGALEENFLFQDVARVTLGEDGGLRITQHNQDAFSAIFQDGPFSTYLAGYDNLFYDAEPNGYDEGQPPDLYSMLSLYNISPADRRAALARYNFYLGQVDVPTTEAQWAAVRLAFANDPNPGGLNNSFGVPSIGLATDITEGATSVAAASIQEAMILYSAEANSSAVTAHIHTAAVPPIPAAGVPQGATFDTFVTPLYVERPSSVFEVTFSSPRPSSPVFSVWVAGTNSPVQASVVTRISSQKFSFSIPMPAIVKIIIG